MLGFFRKKQPVADRAKPLVLHIDDDLDIRAVIAVRLRPMGLDIESVSSGEEGLAAAKARLPDLVILDIRMPDMDGFEVCRRLKEDPKTSAIPVLILTAMGQNRDTEMALSVGAAGYLIKPLDDRKFKAKVVELLRLPPSA
ncbi:MAG: response regulator [Elusimicrobiota bacterium]|nr:response regulator [Elusimicrobiota bacterium]